MLSLLCRASWRGAVSGFATLGASLRSVPKAYCTFAFAEHDPAIPGDLVQFRHGFSHSLGIVKDKDRIFFLVQNSVEVCRVHASKISFVFQRFSATAAEVTDAQMAETQSAANKLSRQVYGEVERIWELFKGRPAFSLNELAVTLFSPQPSEIEKLAGHLFLQQHDTHFQILTRNGHYRCRSKEAMESIQMQRKTLHHQEAVEGFLHRMLIRLLSSNWADKYFEMLLHPRTFFPLAKNHKDLWNSKNDQILLEAIKRYALTDTSVENPDPLVWEQLLRPLGLRQKTDHAFRLLTELGIWQSPKQLPRSSPLPPSLSPSLSPPTPAIDVASNVFAVEDAVDNVHRLRATHHAMVSPFDDLHLTEVEKPQAGTLVHPLWPSLGRRDLRDMLAFAVDDVDTVEVDDAISLTSRNGKEWVYIHIADPTHIIEPESTLEKMARERITTIYLPEYRRFMLPLPLISPKMSILPNQATHTLSFAVRLSEDGSIAEYEIFPSVLSNVRSCTYTDVEAALRPSSSTLDPFDATQRTHLLRIHELAVLRHKYRLASGASIFNIPQIKVQVLEDRRVNLKPIEQNSPARLLVAEMMILAGEVAAVFARSSNIPISFRTQASPDFSQSRGEEFINSLPPLARDFEAIRYCKSAATEAEPRPHDAVGLEAYSRVTSPLRRYSDLLTHYQLKAFLAGQQLPFDFSTADKILQDALVREREVKRLQHVSEIFWKLRYLRQNGPKTYDAIVLDAFAELKLPGEMEDTEGAVIFVEEVCLIQFLGDLETRLQVGDRIKVFCSEVSMFRAVFHLQH